MKKFTLLSAILFCFVLLTTGQTDSTTQTGNSSRNSIPDYIRERKAFKRSEWFYNQRAFPYDTIPVIKYSQEMTKEIQKAKSNVSKDYSDLTWTSVGPAGFHYPLGNFSVVSGRVRAVAVHPTDPMTIYIGAASGGIWKTIDGGQNWQDIGHDLPSSNFGAIAIDPNNPEIVYAGSGESVFLTQFNIYPGTGLYKSTDGGQNWNVITDGFGTVTFFSDLAVSPYNSNVVIASLCHGSTYCGINLSNKGVWKSTDGGFTWNRCLDVLFPFDIAFHPTDPNIVYAAAGGLWSPIDGFYISSDQGETWVQSINGLGLTSLGGRIQFDVSQSNPAFIYSVIYEWNYGMGVTTKAYKSVNSGYSWMPISTGIPLGGNWGSGWTDQGWYDLCIAVDPVNPDHVLIGNIELHRTTNGSTFSPVRPFGNNAEGSLVHADYHKLVFAPSDPNILYIGCDGGIYKSPDKGYSAVSLNQGLETMQFYRITSHPVNPEVIAGGMQDNGGVRTGDGGVSWQSIIGQDAMECFFDYTNPDIFFIMLNDGYLFKSLQGGLLNTFDLIYEIHGAFITPIFMHPTNPDILYTANTNILKSSDGGESFDIIAPDVASQNISTMAQSRVNPNNMIFGTGTGHPVFDSIFMVKISTDEGVTWTDVTSNIPGEERWISRVETDPVDANTMYILRTGFSPGNKVWKTTDLGQTWTNISGDLPDDLPDLPCSDLFIDPENHSHLYVANDVGIYRSTNGGTSWEYASQGVPCVPAIDFDYVKIGTDRYLRVGTYGRSIYQTLLPAAAHVKDNLAKHGITIIPNPSNDKIMISTPAFIGITRLSIFNVSGEKVIERQITNNKTQLDISALPRGVYFVRVWDEKMIEVTKLIKQ